MDFLESRFRVARSAAFIALFAVAIAAAAEPVAEGRSRWRSVCTGEEGPGLRSSNESGCAELGRRRVDGLGDGAVYWHVARLTRPEIEAGLPSSAWIVEAEEEAWSYTFGPRDETPPHGERVATIGPLPLAPGSRHEIIAYHTVMAPGGHSAVHAHPGPEAWYLLSGEQCVETPAGTSRVAAGGSMVAPSSVPMRLTSTGSGARRALAIVVHDPERPQALTSDWLPRGRCQPDDPPRIAWEGVSPRAGGPRAPSHAADTRPSPRIVGAEDSPPSAPAAAAPGRFSFAGLSLGSTLADLDRRYPRSKRVGSYVYVAPEESHDHVRGVEVPGRNGSGRLRITFESRPDGASRPAYPACGEVEASLERSYGPPSGVRHFFEEASKRADRIWQQNGERLELLCFGDGEDLRAEAIVISASR